MKVARGSREAGPQTGILIQRSDLLDGIPLLDRKEAKAQVHSISTATTLMITQIPLCIPGCTCNLYIQGLELCYADWD